jgi:hypothetical protein
MSYRGRVFASMVQTNFGPDDHRNFELALFSGDSIQHFGGTVQTKELGTPGSTSYPLEHPVQRPLSRATLVAVTMATSKS